MQRQKLSKHMPAAVIQRCEKAANKKFPWGRGGKEAYERRRKAIVKCLHKAQAKR